MKTTRLTLFAFLALAVLSLAQYTPAQGPQVNGGTQIKLLPIGGGDNWQRYIPTGVIDGTNASFSIPLAVKKIHTQLNGVEEYQGGEIPPTASPNVSVVYGIGSPATTIVTFLSPIPQKGDVVVIEATQ